MPQISLSNIAKPREEEEENRKGTANHEQQLQKKAVSRTASVTKHGRGPRSGITQVMCTIVFNPHENPGASVLSSLPTSR